MTNQDNTPKTQGQSPIRRSLRLTFARRYGGGPGHLLSMMLGLSLAGYVLSILLNVGHRFEILLWVAGAIVAHDLILFPLYTTLDAALSRLGARRSKVPVVPWHNHVRAPIAISALLLLMTFPLVFNLSEPTYKRATGLTTSVYLGRWALISGVLCGTSACIYAVRLALASLRKKHLAAEVSSHDG